MHSSPFSKKHQARLLGKNQREKYPFLFKLISALDSNSREKKSDLSHVVSIVVAKSRGSIYSLFLSEDPPATKALS
jgi:hypothetical protein